MRAEITDRAALRSLSAIDFRAYLGQQGWREIGRIGDKATVHTRADATGREWEILLPVREAVADFPERMAEAVAAVAHVEGRSQPEVFADLAVAGADVVRLRAPEADAQGTIPIQDGVAFYNEAENLLLAAACSTAKPRRRSYHARKITEAMGYLETVRLGQTERGSYVLTLLSPVQPALKRQQPLPGPEFDEEPFGRRVTRRLAEALDAVRSAVTEAMASEDFAAFERAVTKGVSANLCQAIANLAQRGRGLDIGLSWARVRPAPTIGMVRCQFSLDEARVLDSAAREFRKDEPRLEETLIGYVIGLDREVPQFDGKATLQVLVGNQPRRVRVTFEPGEYNTIIGAFQTKKPLMLDGDLYQVGQRLELRNPRGIAVLDEPGGEPTSESETPLGGSP